MSTYAEGIMADEKKPTPFAQAFGLAGIAADTARDLAKQALGSTVIGVQEAVSKASQGTRDTALALAQRVERQPDMAADAPPALVLDRAGFVAQIAVHSQTRPGKRVKVRQSKDPR